MADDVKTPRASSATGESEKLALYELDSSRAKAAAEDEARDRAAEHADLSGDIRTDTLRDAAYWHMGGDVVLPLGATAVFLAPDTSIADLTFARDGDDLVVINPLGEPARLEDAFAGGDAFPAVETSEGIVVLSQLIAHMEATGQNEFSVSSVRVSDGDVQLGVTGTSGDLAVLYLGDGEFAEPDSGPVRELRSIRIAEEEDIPDPGRAPTDINSLDGAFDILEHSLEGTLIGRVQADDPDAGDTLRYSLSDDAGGRFSIDAATGDIRVADASLLDFEASASHTISIVATDSYGNTVAKEFTITLQDIVEALDGDEADNLLQALHGSDIVRGHGGDDTLLAGAGDDTLEGGTGDDTLSGQTGDDVVMGGDGDDTILYGAGDGSDTVDGGAGTDTLVVTGSADMAQTFRIEDGATYNARTGESRPLDHVIVTSSDGSVFIDAVDIESVSIIGSHPGDQVLIDGDFTAAGLSGGFNLSGIQSVDASGLDSAHAVETDANAGDGTFIGGQGDDTISGGAGSDTLVMPGAWSDYTIADLGGGTFQLTSRIDGEVDTIDGVEIFQFADVTLAASDILNTGPDDLEIDTTAIAEDATAGTVVGTVTGADSNTADTLTYTLVNNPGGMFEIDPASGLVSLAAGASLDHDTQPTVTIRVAVTDEAGASYEEDVTIDVTNINEVPVDIAAAGLSVAENSGAGTVVATLTNTDPDAGDAAANTYTLLSVDGTPITGAGGELFEIVGDEVRVKAGADIDFEADGDHTIEVQVTDPGGLTYTESFTVNVTDVNEAADDLSAAGLAVEENAAAGTVVATLASTDPDAGDAATHTYSLVSINGVAVSGAGGELFEVVGNEVRVKAGADIDFEADGDHVIEVQVTDAGGLTRTESFTVTVADDTEAASLTLGPVTGDEDTGIPLNISAGDLEAGAVHSVTISDMPPGAVLSAGVDNGDGTWTLGVGDLAGLTVTPPADSDVDFSLTVTLDSDQGGDTASVSGTVAVTVDAVADAPSLVLGDVSGNEDTAIALDITTALSDADGSEVLSITVSGVPAGAALSAGVDNGDGSWTLAPGDVAGLTFTPAADENGDFTLTVTATATEGDNGDIATTSDTLDVSVAAVNDNPDDISAAGLSVDENSGAGAVVATLASTDPDAGDAASHSYSLLSVDGAPVSGAGGELFEIVGNEVRVKAGADIDFEADGDHTIEVQVTDAGGLTHTESFTVTVTDVNEAATDIGVAGGTIAEDAADGTVAATLSATDEDSGESFTYAIVDGSGNPVADSNFEIVGNEVRVKAGNSLDFENATDHTIKVEVTDSGGNTYTEDVTINLSDVNDTAQTFTSAGSANAAEGSGDTDVLYTAATTDADTTGEAITYSLVDDAGGKFEIDANTGEVTLAGGQTLDYETATSHTITIRSSDGTNTTDQAITINVTDEADEAATDITVAGGTVAEDAADGTVAATLGAVDADAGDTFTYAIVDGAGNPIADSNFEIVGNEVRVKAGNSLDFENATDHTIKVEVTDSGGNTYTEDVTINLSDVNDTAQTFTSAGSANAAEGSGDTDVLYTAATTDADTTGEAITYSLVDDAGGKFEIDANTGEVTLAGGQTLDYETATSHTITIRSSDGTNTTDQAVTINVTDEADETATDITVAGGTVAEDAADGAVAATLGAVDADAGDTFTYAIVDGAGNPIADSNFEIVGNEVRVKAGNSLDFENATDHTIKVEVTDSGGNTYTEDITINLSDVNDTAQTFTSAGSANATEGSADTDVLYTAATTDADTTGEAITYSLVDDAGGKFEIDANTGEVTLAGGQTLDYETATSHNITIRSSDGTNTTDQAVTINVTDEVDESATDITVAGGTVAEDAADGTVAATLGAVDADAGDTFTYAIVDGAGNPIADSNFEIVGSEVRVKAGNSLDFENATDHMIKVEVTDSGGNTYIEDVTINLSDVNDTAQVFSSAGSSNAAESSADTNVLYTAAATDADTTGEAITYSLVDDDGGKFEIDTNTGEVTLASGQSLDYETATSHTITIRSSDGTNTTDQAVTINVTDEVDEAATDITVAGGTVAEDSADGTVAATLGAVDADAGDTFTYAIVDGAGNPIADSNFEIVGNEVRVKAGNSLDFENATDHMIKVEVTDSGGNTYTEDITINLSDVNDTAQTFSSAGSANAVEGSADSDVLYTAATTDADTTGEAITYSLVDDDGGKFEIDTNTGEVTLASGESLDYETATSHTITIRSSDGTNTTDQAVTINVTDEVDEAATDITVAGGTVAEDSADGTVAATLGAVDADAGDTFTYAIVDGAGNPIADSNFEIVGNEVRVKAGNSLDFENATDHMIKVEVTDSGGNTYTEDVTINLSDVNDTAQAFTSAGSANVAEGSGDTDVLYTAATTDADTTGEAITYSLVDDAGGKFEIDANTGEVTLAGGQTLDYETATSHTITIRSSDGTNTTDQAITINVTDEADEAATDITVAGGTVAEDAADGTVAATLGAVDADAGDTFTYAIVDGAGNPIADSNFEIVGNEVRVKAGNSLDFENATGHTIKVEVTDSGGNTYTEDLTINLSDVNDTAQAFTSGASANAAEGSADTDVLYTAATTDADTTGEAITYSLVDDAGGKFEIDANTGEVTLASGQTLDYETATSHTITIRSSDGTNTTDQAVTINVTDEVDESATDITVAGGTVAENAADGTVAATLGAVDADAGDTFTYAIVDGAGNPIADSNFEIVGNEVRVKTGNSLDFEGATDHTIKVQVTDSGGNTYTEDVTINLSDVNDTAQTFTSSGSASATEDSADTDVLYTAATTDADTTGEAITYSLADDAGGKFEIDANTGEVTLASGQTLDYETATSHNITIRSSDGTNTTDQAVTINVTDEIDEAPTDISFSGNESALNSNVLSLNTDGGTDDNAIVSGLSWPTGDFSFEVMLNSDTIGSNGSPIVSYATAGDANEFSIIARDGSDGYDVSVYLNGSNHTISGLADEIFDGNDHRISVTWDQSSGQMKFYLDGTLEDTATMAAGSTLTSGGTLTFGQEQDSVGGGYSSSQMFEGTMGDIRVFNDVRTSGEIDDNQGGPLDDPGSEGGLVHNWQMNESGGQIVDEVGGASMSLVNDAALEQVVSPQVGAVVASVDSVADADAGDSFTYALTDDGDGLFAIDAGTGDISIASLSNAGAGAYITTNSVNSHTVTVQATDSGGNTYTEDVTFHFGSTGSDAISGGAGTDIIYGMGGSSAGGLGSNLIVNGSFEVNEVTSHADWQEFSSVTGWNRLGSVFELQEDGLGGQNTPHGNQWLELDANGSVDGVYQDVTTEAGKDYQFSFDAAERSGHTGGTNTILVYWNGALIDTVDPTSTSFETYSYTVTGTGGADRLEFRETSGDNDHYGALLDNVQLQEVIAGGGDTINGGDGDDAIYAGAGDDVLSGGDGDDVVYAGAGDDLYDDGVGTNNDDSGNDYIDMGAGNDTAFGDAGDDTIIGGDGNDSLVGEDGADSLLGGSGNDTLEGGSGDDTLEGGVGVDSLMGGDGSDLFVFGAGEGNDVLYGGSGGGWTDVVDLSGGGASPGVYGDDWTISFDSGGEASSTGSSVELTDDSSGTINLSDGTQIEFHEIERIIW